MIDPVVVERDGARCVRTYTMATSRGRSGASHGGWISELEITRGADRRERHVEVELFPFSTDELRERLRSSGFTHISIDAITDDDRYTAVARRGVTRPSKARGEGLAPGRSSGVQRRPPWRPLNSVGSAHGVDECRNRRDPTGPGCADRVRARHDSVGRPRSEGGARAVG